MGLSRRAPLFPLNCGVYFPSRARSCQAPSPAQTWADGECFPWPLLEAEAIGGILSIVGFGFPTPPSPAGSCLCLTCPCPAAEPLGILSPLGPGGLGFSRSSGIPGATEGFFLVADAFATWAERGRVPPALF